MKMKFILGVVIFIGSLVLVSELRLATGDVVNVGGKFVEVVEPYWVVCRVPHGEGVKNVVYRTNVKYPWVYGGGIWVFRDLDSGEHVASTYCHFQRGGWKKR